MAKAVPSNSKYAEFLKSEWDLMKDFNHQNVLGAIAFKEDRNFMGAKSNLLILEYA